MYFLFTNKSFYGIVSVSRNIVDFIILILRKYNEIFEVYFDFDSLFFGFSD